MLKHSKQRECILEYLMSTKEHPTAETVYMNIKEELPKISLATVYRNLSLLAEMGTILKIVSADGPDRFDAYAKPHNHFTCTKCGSVIDLPVEDFDDIDAKVSKGFGGIIQGHSIMFKGICPGCV